MSKLAERCGWKFFDRVTGMELRGPEVDDQVANQLRLLKHLERLTLDRTRISAASIAKIRADHPDCIVLVENPQPNGGLIEFAQAVTKRSDPLH